MRDLSAWLALSTVRLAPYKSVMSGRGNCENDGCFLSFSFDRIFNASIMFSSNYLYSSLLTFQSNVSFTTQKFLGERWLHCVFSAQIFFDDAFELESDGSSHYVVNQFVRDMMVSLPIAVREVYCSNVVKIAPADMMPTPYGGRLVYQLPGGTKLVVHLKDKQKIRHRKRWSQVRKLVVWPFIIFSNWFPDL